MKKETALSGVERANIVFFSADPKVHANTASSLCTKIDTSHDQILKQRQPKICVMEAKASLLHDDCS